jgi:Alpha amylase, catalytic domain
MIKLSRDQMELAHLKSLLSGRVSDLHPYRFWFLGRNEVVVSENAGLEGFYFTALKIKDIYGSSVIEEQLLSILSYLEALCQSASSCKYASELWVSVRAIQTAVKKNQSSIPLATNELFTFLAYFIQNAQRVLLRLDKAHWIKTASTYQLLLSAFNLRNLEQKLHLLPAASSSPLESITPHHLPAPFSAIRWTGTFPRERITAGEVKARSPFSITTHATIDRAWGERDKIVKNLRELKSQNICSIFELLPNHTSLDSDFLSFSPTLFIHTTERPAETEDYFYYFDNRSQRDYWIRYGGYAYDNHRFYWRDTLQLDISNPATLIKLCTDIKELIKTYGVNGFRVDMAYQLQNHRFLRLWSDEIGFPLGLKREDEFLYKLIQEVKRDFPDVAFIAEGFDSFDLLSELSFDLVYSKNEMTLTGGTYHEGWYNALESRDPHRISKAIERASFLIWQKGGAGMLAFIGHHDLPAPVDVFGDWLWGATVLTLMLPTSVVWYNGTEVNFKEPCTDNQKMITFNYPVEIDWSGVGGEWYRFVGEILSFRKKLEIDYSSDYTIKPLFNNNASLGVVGYLIYVAEKPKAVVIANLGESKDISIDIEGFHRTYKLDFIGPTGWVVEVL